VYQKLKSLGKKLEKEVGLGRHGGTTERVLIKLSVPRMGEKGRGIGGLLRGKFLGGLDLP